jgi:hypothetical protein
MGWGFASDFWTGLAGFAGIKSLETSVTTLKVFASRRSDPREFVEAQP